MIRARSLANLRGAGAFGRIGVSLLVAMLLLGFAPSENLHAQSADELAFLTLYFTRDELQIISTTRALKSVARVAENVTVLSADDIRSLNVHTLAEVLRDIPGVQLANAIATPGSAVATSLQGSEIRHVAVLLDGIPLNNLSDNVFDIGLMPVQHIARLEIIKGTASSVWGSALGGVVNIITKATPPAGVASGQLSGSHGRANTEELRADTAGRSGELGYYLAAGTLQSDGLQSGFDVSTSNAFAKLDYNPTAATDLSLLFMYIQADRGDGHDGMMDLDFSSASKHLYSGLFLHSSPASSIALDLSLWTVLEDDRFFIDTLADRSTIFRSRADGTRRGGRASLSWKRGVHDLVLGLDYAWGRLKQDTLPSAVTEDEWALFANDSIVYENLSITPGLRFDSTRLGESFLSPSLGATYALRRETILRMTLARGFTSPTATLKEANNEFFSYQANPNLTSEVVRSMQLGLETMLISKLWLKATAFRHVVTDIIGGDAAPDSAYDYTLVNKDSQRRQGLEVDFKAVPLERVAVYGGAAFIKAVDRRTGETVPDTPRRTYDLALSYNDPEGLRALIACHYVDWNGSPELQGKDEAVVIDARVSKRVYTRGTHRLEVFLNLWNLSDASQYLSDAYKNAGRWLEAGLIYRY